MRRRNCSFTLTGHLRTKALIERHDMEEMKIITGALGAIFGLLFFRYRSGVEY